jgi:hypothetical protein
MITQFIEASQPEHVNWGKFLLARFDEAEGEIESMLPGFKGNIFRTGGQRTMNPNTTLVVDLQTGEGAAFSLDGNGSATYDLNEHKIWVCPMYEPFLCWLYMQHLGNGKGDIRSLPRYVELPTG